MSSPQAIGLCGRTMALDNLDPLDRYHFCNKLRMQIMCVYIFFYFPDDVPMQIPIKYYQSNNLKRTSILKKETYTINLFDSYLVK